MRLSLVLDRIVSREDLEEGDNHGHDLTAVITSLSSSVSIVVPSVHELPPLLLGTEHLASLCRRAGCERMEERCGTAGRHAAGGRGSRWRRAWEEGRGGGDGGGRRQ